MKAVLFDFNGTLFFDKDINRIAWEQTINELSNNTINFDKVYSKYASVRNQIFVEAIFDELGLDKNPEDIDYWVKRKETQYYHNYCREHNRKDLAPGAEEFLNYLVDKHVPFNLCTASIQENVDFYFDFIGIKKWFNKNLVVYDTGEYKNKVEMYQECAKRIGTDICECIVFEDSNNSIKQAIDSGCENIIVVNNDDYIQHPEIIKSIKDFRELDFDEVINL